MKKTLISAVVLSLCLSTHAYAGDFKGPLVIKNGHPLYALINNPSLTSAEPENSLDINFSYSSTYLVEGPRDWHFGVDLETALLDIQLRRRVGNGTEVGFDLPVIRYGAGFMDDFMELYHSALFMPDTYGKNLRGRNAFLFEVTRNGTTIVRGDAGKTAIGDPRIDLKKSFYSDDISHISIQGFLSLPVGNPDEGYGAGRPHGGVALLMNKLLRRNLMLYVNAGFGRIGKLTALQDVNLHNYFYGGTGLEWNYSGEVSLYAQFFMQTSPYPKASVRSMDDWSMLASAGGRYALSDKSSLGIAVTEDPDTTGAPDFMMSVDYKYKF